MRYKRDSRLDKRLEQKTKERIIFSVLGMIAVLFVMTKYGIPFLIQTTSFISSKSSSEIEIKPNQKLFLSSPVLNPLPTATNSARIIVSGFASPEKNVNLYVNNSLIDKTDVDKEGTFEFDSVSVKKGENTIKAKSTGETNQESDFSNELTIFYKDSAPNLTLQSPSEGQTLSKDQNPLTVSGKTDPGSNIRINGFWAIVDGSGGFLYNLSLSSGENKIKVVAEDEAGNKTELERKVTFNP